MITLITFYQGLTSLSMKVKFQRMLVPIILSGGAGTRLWPVSREAHPKPFMRLHDGLSLIQKTFLRASKLKSVKEIITITNRELYFATQDEYHGLHSKTPYSFLLEPFGRNTAPAIVLAAFFVQETHGKNATLLILPADHVIENESAFQENCAQAKLLAEKNKLVTFGITPNKPETGFGYIEKGDAEFSIRCFVEKPDLKTAEQYIASGNYFWNSGMFCFRADVLLQEIQKEAPALLAAAEKCWEVIQKNRDHTSNYIEVDRDSFANVPDVSIDYALMEKTKNIAMIPALFDWNDVGTWDAYSKTLTVDAAGNSITGEAVLVNTQNTFVHSQHRMTAVIGGNNLVIVDTDDALLVANRDQSQDVRKVVQELKQLSHQTYREHSSAKEKPRTPFQNGIRKSPLHLLCQKFFLNKKNTFEKPNEKLVHPELRVANITLDYSHQFCSVTMWGELLALLESLNLPQKLKDFKEKKAPWDLAGHIECRNMDSPETQGILQNMEKMVKFVESQNITDVVNIGMGGSYLGPCMVNTALYTLVQPNAPRCHYVANLDEVAIKQVLKNLNPETTLIVAVSKTFTTEEMLSNFKIATSWLKQKERVLAITAFPERAEKLGILKTHILSMPKNVGGRYSLWTSVGLTIALSIGMKHFRALLAGAHAMDQHFLSAAFAENMPVVLALFGILCQNFFGMQTQAVIPYAESLKFFTEYLQQLCMESLGKSVTIEGQTADYATGAIIWGGVGTNTQHTVQQMILQGTNFIPVDFILIKNRSDVSEANTKRLQEYAYAQTQAMSQGMSVEQAQKHLMQAGFSEFAAKTEAPHRAVLMQQPVNLISVASLTPETLGALIALYEHKVLVQAMLWNINPFDQWGVELSKQIAREQAKC